MELLPLAVMASEIKNARTMLHLSQKEIAKALQKPQSQISKIENEEINPSYELIYEIFALFHEKKTENQRNKLKYTAGKLATRKIIIISPETSVYRALEIMHQNGFSQVPVVENGKSIGTIYENSSEKLSKDMNLEGISVRKIMSRPLQSVFEDKDFETVKIMQKNSDGHTLLLVDDEQKPIGIITQDNINEAIRKQYEERKK